MPAPRPLPPSIGPGARIGLFALSGPVNFERVAEGLAILRGAGFEPVVAPNLRRRVGYLAGSDDARVEGLQYLLDTGVDALLAARGGYGIARILDRLPYGDLATWGGWIVGFSDVTALHAALGHRVGFATLHGPMATTLSRCPRSSRILLRWLTGRPASTLFRVAPSQVVRGGRVRGVATGGNLSMLCALEGTEWAPDYEGAVLFVEDVGEPLYRLDRLLTQLRLSSRLARVAAIVAGRLTECCRGEPRWRSRWRELLLEAAPPSCVVVEGAQFGHGKANVSIPLGVEVVVDTDRGVIGLGGS